MQYFDTILDFLDLSQITRGGGGGGGMPEIRNPSCLRTLSMIHSKKKSPCSASFVLWPNGYVEIFPCTAVYIRTCVCVCVTIKLKFIVVCLESSSGIRRIVAHRMVG